MTPKPDSPTDITEIEPEAPRDPYRLVIPVQDYGTTEWLKQSVRTAAEVVRNRKQAGELAVLSLIQLPEQTPLERSNVGDHRIQQAEDTATQLMQVGKAAGITATKSVRLMHYEVPPILDIAATSKCGGVFIITQAEQSRQQSALSKQTAMEVTARAESDVFVHRLGSGSNTVQRILLAVGGGPHSTLATESARALACTHDASVDVIHVYPESATDLTTATTILQNAESRLTDIELFETGLLPSANAAEKIIARSRRHDVTVLGAPTVDPLRQFVFGSNISEAENAQETTSTVLMARQHSEAQSD